MCVWWQQIGDWAPPSCAQEKPAAGEASHRGDPTTVLLTGAHRFTHKPLKRLPFQVEDFPLKYLGKHRCNEMFIWHNQRDSHNMKDSQSTGGQYHMECFFKGVSYFQR